MVDNIRKEDCCGCGACNNICPVNAIYMDWDEEGFLYPHINMEKCILCEQCVQVCPSNSRKAIRREILRAYACYATDTKLRNKSTSGGVSAVLAEYFINELQANIYGVKFDKNFNTVFCCINKKEEIKDIQGSKYVQADTKDIYKDIKNKLEKQEYVLFSGMPCQVEALRSFLMRDYEKLYIIDIVCFGIASPVIWESYLKNFHDISKITEVVFKDKKAGWKNWKVKITENGKATYFDMKENLYMNSYLQRINLRPSCFQCKFKGIHRNSDFSVADCWGIGEENVNLNDNKGLSALLIHTRKGQDIFEEIKIMLRYEEYQPEILMAANWAVENSPKINDKREEFFKEFRDGNFREIFIKYFKIQE